MEDSINCYLKEPLTLRNSCLQIMANPIELILEDEYTHTHTHTNTLNSRDSTGLELMAFPFATCLSRIVQPIGL